MRNDKIGSIFLISVLALAGIGISYSGFTDNIHIYGFVDTAVVDLTVEDYSGTWVWKVWATEENAQPPVGEIYFYHGFVSERPTDDEVRDMFPGCDVLLVSKAYAMDGTQHGDTVYDVDMVWDNIFPCIDFTADVIIHYKGSIPAKLQWPSIIWHEGEEYFIDCTTLKAYKYTLENEEWIKGDEITNWPYQVHYCYYIGFEVTIHIPQQNDLQDKHGEFSFNFEVIQWNDECGEPENPGIIIVEKQTTPDGSSQSFEFSTNFSSNFFLEDNETYTSDPLVPGVYSVAEINIPNGWSLVSATCSDGSDPSAIDLSANESVVCTFVNEELSYEPGFIVVEKQTDPDGVNEIFEFSSSFGPNFFLGDGETYNSGPLVPGTYVITEIDPGPYFELTSMSASSSESFLDVDLYARTITINLVEGDIVECEFINENTSMGRIFIVKQTYPDGSSQSFEFSSSFGPNFFLSDNHSYYSGRLMPGIYSVSEINIPDGWSLVSATCSDGSDPSAIDLSANESVVCTFVNEELT